MRSKGSRFTLGVWGSGGWGCVRSTLLNRSQQSATVRNRPQPSATACAIWPCLWRVLQRGHFWGFKRRIASFRVAGVALCDIQACFITWQKSFCVANAICLRRFHTMSCIFRGTCSTLETCIVSSRGRRSTSDVSVCLFFANRNVRAVWSGGNVQIP